MLLEVLLNNCLNLWIGQLYLLTLPDAFKFAFLGRVPYSLDMTLIDRLIAHVRTNGLLHHPVVLVLVHNVVLDRFEVEKLTAVR